MALIERMGIKFEHKKYDGLDGRTKEEWSNENLSLVADQEKVVIKGTLNLTDHKDLQEFAKFLSDVWKAHMRLAPKIFRPGEQ